MNNMIISTVCLDNAAGDIVAFAWQRPTKTQESPALLQHLEDTAKATALSLIKGAPLEHPVRGVLTTNWEGEKLEGWFSVEP